MTARIRTIAEQHQIDDALGLPRYLRGWRVERIIFSRDAHKARKLIAWLANAGGAAVAAFPIDRATPPAICFDAATGWERRCRKPEAKPAKVIALPAHDQTANAA